MRVLVLSDTHIPIAQEKLPPIIQKEAKSSDYCLHAGDFISYSVYKDLSSWTKTIGVCGNMDEPELQEKLSQKEIIKIEDVTIGLTHGRGSPSNLLHHINNVFLDDSGNIDIFVFGHSHYPIDKEIEGKLYFNPGSPTDKVFSPYLSYGIFEIDGSNIKRRIVKVE